MHNRNNTRKALNNNSHNPNMISSVIREAKPFSPKNSYLKIISKNDILSDITSICLFSAASASCLLFIS